MKTLEIGDSKDTVLDVEGYPFRCLLTRQKTMLWSVVSRELRTAGGIMLHAVGRREEDVLDAMRSLVRRHAVEQLHNLIVRYRDDRATKSKSGQ